MTDRPTDPRDPRESSPTTDQPDPGASSDGDVVAERQRQEEQARRDGHDERDEALATGTEDESGYSTEIEQGAAAPRGDA